MRIYVNDMAKDVSLGKVSYSQVVLMALYHTPVQDRLCPTVSYCLPSADKYTGMPPRSSVRICPGMKFVVVNGKRIERQAASATQVAVESTKTRALDWPAHFTEEMKAAEIARVQELMAPHEARYQAQQAARKGGELEARLKDAYVIINLLYQEAVAEGRMTPGRRMAGTLLYSAGYEQIVKKLENQ